MPPHLEPHVFDLPVQELRRGYRSDIYFWREKLSLENHNLHPEVTMQVFQKKDAVLCGVDEAVAVLKLAAGRYTDYTKAYKLFDRLIELKSNARRQFIGNHKAYLKAVEEKMEVSSQLDELWESGFEQLKVETLNDGARISPWETVMHITGDAALFAHLETVYLGILARRTKIASNVRSVVDAANGKIVLYFPARFDHWAVQGGDGYAAHIGGATGVSTDAQAQWWGAKASGTVPHALIAAVGGDTVKAITLFGETYPEVDLVALVDFDNDCVGTSLKCCEALGKRLWGVRLDTAETLVDKSIIPVMRNFKPTGVTPRLVEMTRTALDKHGFKHVKIIVSGGFSPDRIAEFEKLQMPVDAYGVGSYLMRGVNAFTADIVLLEGKPCAKVGRQYTPNPRLELVS
jgi:nicotinate phosphoribosyltransferase